MRNSKAIPLLGCLLLPSLSSLAADISAPPMMLANRFEDVDADLTQYWISEKYDGIRAYWDGERLLTRGGNLISAPEWFTAGWPNTAFDGELWMGRGQFETVAATVRDAVPDETAWRRVQFMVFDLPRFPGAFTQRLTAMQSQLQKLDIAWLRAVAHFQVADADQLQARLLQIVTAGGEGLMLHRGAAMHRAERSDDLLKLKRFQDAEARVIGYTPGKGKYEGAMGALLVETREGLQFRLGTGFTDAQRHAPPAIGSWVTYSYQDLTQQGIPRFARFLRVRNEE